MPTITFYPQNKVIEMPEGAPLLEAARLTGVFVQTPCGGKGTCGKCACFVTGAVDFDNAKGIDTTGGKVLICRTKIKDEPVTVRLPDEQKESGKFDGMANLKDYLPKRTDPYLKTVTVQTPPPAMLDGLSDADRAAQAFNKTIQSEDSVKPELTLSALQALPETLRTGDGRVQMSYVQNGGVKIIRVAGHDEKNYGAAIDIGTTTVALLLTDLATGEIIFSRSAYNGQIDCGLDVISRINYARKYLPELTKRIVGTINSLLSLCPVQAEQITLFSIAGNTTMIHLLLGIPAEYLRLSPYTPAVMNPSIYNAQKLGFDGHPEAPVLIAPAVGSYVGGDITAGALCTSLVKESDDTVLFIDIGTNGELLLGNSEFLFGCACSAGPAFEGGGIKCGMRASIGAIEKVSIDATGKATVATIGTASPVGICGSGVISLAAELFRTGMIDMAGKFNDNPYVKRAGRSAEYHVCENITFSETDLDNFIRAKAAIFSACQTLMDSVGLTFGDIDRFYVAGGFGRFLNLTDARTIGLLPKLSDEKFVFLGNSSLIGAYLCLISETRRTQAHALANRLTYVDLSNEPRYMDKYMAALFLPHTDIKLFA